MRFGFDILISIGGFPWKCLYENHWMVKPYKYAEFSINYYAGRLFQLEVHYRTRTTDHQGLDFVMFILGLGVELSYYDSRHGDQREEVDTTPGPGPVQG